MNERNLDVRHSTAAVTRDKSVVAFTLSDRKSLVFFNRGLFIIDEKSVLRQITMNDLPVGR